VATLTEIDLSVLVASCDTPSYKLQAQTLCTIDGSHPFTPAICVGWFAEVLVDSSVIKNQNTLPAIHFNGHLGTHTKASIHS
jgi:hypothetical protein